MPMFPSASLLHAQVAAKMRAKELKTNVGALIYVTRKEMIERGRPVNDGIHNLDIDIRNQFVYVDPIRARESAANLREAAAHSVGLPVQHQFLELADKFDADAKICEERMKGKDPAMVKVQIDFYTSFYDFKNKWDDFYYDIQFKAETAFDTKFLGNEISNQIDGYYVQYIGYADGFKKIGGSMTIPPPPPSKAGDVHLPEIPNPIGSGSIPWSQIALFAGAALAVYWVVNRKPAEPVMVLPERRVGPPNHLDSEEAALARAHL